MYDIHSHVVPSAVLDWLRTHRSDVNATWEQRVAGKEPFLTVNEKWSFELKRPFFQSDLFLQEQLEAGMVHTLVSPIPQLFLYEMPWQITRDLATLYNEALAEWVRLSSGRLSGLASVPLNAPDVAAAMLEAAMRQGLKGVIIGPGYNQLSLSDPFFTPLFEAADAMRAIVFIHPVLNEDPRIQRMMMPNMIGVPWETTLCALDLMLGGILDRFPNIRFLLAHGGGFLPYQIGRCNQGYEVWPAVKHALKEKPEHYLKRFWYDNVLWHPSAEEHLIRIVGQDRVLPGSDYPFDLKVWPPASADEQAVIDFLR